MGAADFNINLPLSFDQIVGIIKKLPYNEQLKLGKILQKEAKQKADYDKVLTHFASESVLAQDWELPEEGEAWKDL